MKIVIVNDEMGIYVGHAMGMGFWTLLDSVGQPEACTFDTSEEAAQHIRSWDDGNDPVDYRFVEVSATGSYATISDLKKAGLAYLLGDMEVEALRYADTVGNA